MSKPTDGIAALVPAELVVVVERIDVRGFDVGVVVEIAVHVEQRVRIAPFLPAGLSGSARTDRCPRPRRPDCAAGNRRSRSRSPRSARSARSAGGPRCAPKRRKCAQRIDVRRRHVRIGGEIGAPDRSVSDGTRPSFQPAWSKCASGSTPAALHVRIGREIDRGREERVRIAALLPADAVVVRVGVGMRVPHVVVLRIVEQVVDQRVCRRCCSPCRR